MTCSLTAKIGKSFCENGMSDEEVETSPKNLSGTYGAGTVNGSHE